MENKTVRFILWKFQAQHESLTMPAKERLAAAISGWLFPEAGTTVFIFFTYWISHLDRIFNQMDT